MIASLVLASAYMFVNASLSPWIGDFPLNAFLGVVGLGLAVLHGTVLLVGFIRSGGL